MKAPVCVAVGALVLLSSCSGASSPDATVEPIPDAAGGDSGGGAASCDALAALFVNPPLETVEADCALTDGTTTTCCSFSFASDLVEDGPYCPESTTSPPPYGLSVYDGATRPGLRPFDGDYLQDIEDDGYDPMVDAEGNTRIVTGLGGPPDGTGSNCLAMAQDFELVLTATVPLSPRRASASRTLGEVEYLGISVMGVPATGDPPSATRGPMMGMGPPAGTAINVPSIGACGAHPDPAGYLHDHFVPQVMNTVLASQGISSDLVSCTTYEQRTTGLYGIAKDGFLIYLSHDADGTLPSDLDGCHGHERPTPELPDGAYHYHASETEAPNFMPCLSGVPVARSFGYE